MISKGFVNLFEGTLNDTDEPSFNRPRLAVHVIQAV